MEIIQIDKLSYLKSKIKINDVFLLETDTIIGISCSIYSKYAKNTMYEIKQRNQNKKFIILIDSYEAIKPYCDLTKFQRKILNKYWPGPVTFLLKSKNSEELFAFRLANDELLNNFIKNFGPVYTTSANIEGDKPPKSYHEINPRVLSNINFAILKNQNLDANKNLEESTIVDISNDKINIIRKGNTLVKGFKWKLF